MPATMLKRSPRHRLAWSVAIRGDDDIDQINDYLGPNLLLTH